MWGIAGEPERGSQMEPEEKLPDITWESGLSPELWRADQRLRAILKITFCLVSPGMGGRETLGLLLLGDTFLNRNPLSIIPGP